MANSENGVQISGEPSAAPADPVAAPGATGPAPAPTAGLNPAALTVAQAARLLGVAEQTVRDHVAAGAPAAADGTINLVGHVAWMNLQLKDRDGD